MAAAERRSSTPSGRRRLTPSVPRKCPHAVPLRAAGAAAGGGPEAAVTTGGLQAEGLEPVRLVPGRGPATAADIAELLRDFERQLKPELGKGGLPPRTGAFAVMRRAFNEHGFSTVLDRCVKESARDVFQFVCGTCWRMLLGERSLPKRVAIVFLVYLLYRLQHPDQHDVPVDVVVLEALAALREECEQRQVLLECPKVLKWLCAHKALSVGVVATCRSLFFDRCGRLTERLAKAEEAADPAVKAKMTPGALQSQGAKGAAEGGGGGGSLDLDELLRKVAEHSAQEGSDAADSLQGPVAERVQALGTALRNYARGAPPEGHFGEVAAAADASEPPRQRARRRCKRHKRRLVETASASDSEQARRAKAAAAAAVEAEAWFSPPPTPRGRAVARLGLGEYLQRRQRQAAVEGGPAAEAAPLAREAPAAAPLMQPAPALPAAAAAPAAAPGGGGESAATLAVGEPTQPKRGRVAAPAAPPPPPEAAPPSAASGGRQDSASPGEEEAEVEEEALAEHGLAEDEAAAAEAEARAPVADTEWEATRFGEEEDGCEDGSSSDVEMGIADADD